MDTYDTGRPARRAAGPGRWRRWLYRLPLWFERLGVPAVERAVTRGLGVEWIVVETIGRRSGRSHPVVLDVVGRDADRDIYYVQPAYGRDADWVRNVAAQPLVSIRVGRRRAPARVRDASGTEGAEVVLRFIRSHPFYARLIVWFVGYVDRVDRPDDELRRALAGTPVFAVEVIDPANG